MCIDKPIKIISETKTISYAVLDNYSRLWVACDKNVKCYQDLTDIGLKCQAPSEITSLSVQCENQKAFIAVGCRDHSVRLFEHSFDNAPGQVLPIHQFRPPHLDTVTSIIQYGSYIISGSRDRRIKLWSRDGEVLSEQNAAHADWVVDLKLIPRSRWFASLARDGSVQIWSIDNLDLLDQIPAAENDLISSISVTGDHLFTGAQSKNIKMWDLRF